MSKLLDNYLLSDTSMLVTTLLIQLWMICNVLGGTDDSSTLFGTSPLGNKNFIERATSHKYPAELHYVITIDGYILSVYRIPPNQTCTTTKGVILFMHGLYRSCDDCIAAGPGVSHCYIYSDNCYDVWVPNARGNLYSRNHTTYNPDTDPRFWNFTFVDMAVKDLPACIDYILNATNNTQLSYVGHLQGSTMMIALCSKIPKYNENIKIGIGLPVISGWSDIAKNVYSDYGTINKLDVYEQTSRPLYDYIMDYRNFIVSLVSITSKNDTAPFIKNMTDSDITVSYLWNASVCVVANETFGHLDFINSKYIPKYITPTVLSAIETGTANCTGLI